MGGSVIRVAVPIGSSFKEKEAVGAVVVNHFVPFSLAQKIEQIRAAHDEYRRLQPVRGTHRAPLPARAVAVLAGRGALRDLVGIPHRQGRVDADPRTRRRHRRSGARQPRRAGRSAFRRRGRLPGAFVQPHDPRSARRARRSRAHQRRAGAAPPLHGGGAAQHRRGRGLARRRGTRPHHQSRRPALAQHPARRRARGPLLGRRAARARTALGRARAAAKTCEPACARASAARCSSRRATRR